LQFRGVIITEIKIKKMGRVLS